MQSIELIKNLKECCGCGACLHSCPKKAISMKENEDGFIYPEIDESLCVDCGKCIRVCKFKDAVWEKSLKETYAAYAKDTDLIQSASGGVFASLAQSVLAQGGVVYGCAMLYTEGKMTPRHLCVTEQKDLIKIKGSKYVQSELGDVYVEIKKKLQKDVDVLFSGTPCQVMGLKGYMQKDYNNLYTVEVVCHGVPSVQMFQDYLRYVEEKEEKKVVEFKFRDKSQGWKLHGKMILEDQNGVKTEKYFEPEESSYYQMFLNSYTYRENCYSCPFASEYRQGDITIGDYWCIDLIHPEYLIENGGKMDEKKGASCLVINNEQGKKLMKKYGQGVALFESTYEKASQYNAQLKQPSCMKKEREVVLELKKQGYEEIERWYQKRLSRIRFIRKIRAMIPKWIKKGIRKILGKEKSVS